MRDKAAQQAATAPLPASNPPQPQPPPPKSRAEAATKMRNAAEQQRAAAQLESARMAGAVIQNDKIVPHPDGKGGALHTTGFVLIPDPKDPARPHTIPYREDPDKGTAIPYRDDHGRQHTIPVQDITRVAARDGKATYHFMVDGQPVSVPEGSTPLFQVDQSGKRFTTAPDGSRRELGNDTQTMAQNGVAPRVEAANKSLQEKVAQGAELTRQLTEKQALATAAQQRLDAAHQAVAAADQTTGPDSQTQRIRAREERIKAEEALQQRQQEVQDQQKQLDDHYSASASEQTARQKEIGRYKTAAAASPADAQWQKDANSAHEDTRAIHLALIAEAEKKDPASAAAMRQALIPQHTQRLLAAAEKSFGSAQPPEGNSITLQDMLMQAPEMTQGQGTRQTTVGQAATAQNSLGITDPENVHVTRSADGSYSLTRKAADGSSPGQPFATLDPRTNRITLTPGPDGRPSQAAIDMAAQAAPNGTPIYLPGTQPPLSEAQVSDLIQKGLAATTSTTDRKAADAALTQAGLSPENISQLVQQGRISVQDGQLLNNKFNSGVQANTTPHASPQGFGAWVTDESNPRSQWWRHGTDEQKAVAVHEYFDALAAGRTGDGHITPEAVENLRRQALGDIRPEWGKPGTTTPGQERQNGAARFESIPLKDGGQTLLPGGKWTVEDLEKLHENPVFAKATQAERDAVMNHIIGQSFTDYSHRPGFDQAAYQRFNQIAQQARDKSAALKTWSNTGSDALNFGGNVLGGVVRPIIATATDLSAKDPDGEWRAPLGNVAEQAGYWSQKAKDTVQGFLPEARAAKSKLGSDLESLHQDLINGNFPLNDRAKLDEWLAARSKGLTDSQKAWYEAVQGKPDTSTDKGLSQHIYTHANSLLNPANAELMSKFIQTRDPAVWDELHRNLTRTPQRAETEQAQQKSLEESKIVNFMTQNYGGGDYAEHMQSAGNPIDIASNLLPMVRGLRAGKAAAEAAVLAGKSTLKGSAAAIAKSAAINLGTGGVQTLVENPDATFADLAQAGKENIATALGLHAVGHVAGKAIAKANDLVDGNVKPDGGTRNNSTQPAAPQVKPHISGGRPELPEGAKLLQSSDHWFIFEHNGKKWVRFYAPEARSPNTAKKGGRGDGHDNTAAHLTPEGRIYVSEGQHRLNSVVLENETNLSSVPGHSKWLEYEFKGDTDAIGEPPKYNPGEPHVNENRMNPWDGLDGY